jgi:predicted phosphoadenosine phosphosulfate sulfurtransferase
VGIRSDESLNRWRTIASSRKKRLEDKPWTTWKGRATFNVYPIYDWQTEDVWTYYGSTGLPYNRIYDLRWQMGCGVYNDNRVSNLIHEMSFRSLPELAALEPDTYTRLVRRLKGVHCAARHAQGGLIYDARDLPAGFTSWLAFRDHLLATMPIDDAKRARFQKRFDGQPKTEPVYHAQCKQLLINDWENAIPVPKTKTQPVDRFARWKKLF